MTITKIILASMAAITIINSGALAAQISQGGQITKVDQLNGKITLEYQQKAVAGVTTISDDFKVKDGLPFSAFHAGDKVGFTAEKIDDVWTITAIQKQ